jgi:hypothetical protein
MDGAGSKMVPGVSLALSAAVLLVAIAGAFWMAMAVKVAKPRSSSSVQQPGPTGDREGSDAASASASAPSFASVSEAVSGGCCGLKNLHVSKAAAIGGGVQRITVDVSRGFFRPDGIQLKAGIPAEITFSRGKGCIREVRSSDLDFVEDVSSGPKTVRLKHLAPGTYRLACGMDMVAGKIVVR